MTPPEPMRVTILGATGSIGRSTAAVILANRERFVVEAVVAGSDAQGLAAVALKLGARFAALSDEGAHPALRDALAGSGVASGAGESAVLEAVRREADLVVAGVSGIAGLKPTAASLAPGRRVALANKETLVCAGDFFMTEARRLGVPILPMDSEHNAVAQALAGRPLADVRTVTLTASGGPFRLWEAERIHSARREQALSHPNYAMGAKITVDSAGLMNKGLELIEAHHVFGIDATRLDAVVHPEQIIHGLVGFSDGSLIAGMARPDMRVPIADCLGCGARLQSGVALPDLVATGALHFEAPDLKRFPALRLAKEAMAAGGAMPGILNAANEETVAAFLAGAFSFGEIAAAVAAVLERMAGQGARAPSSVAEALEIDDMTRRRTREILVARHGLAMNQRDTPV
jgi:1-deoxy-D-xylulose-5-phosphate reductoisomerase